MRDDAADSALLLKGRSCVHLAPPLHTSRVFAAGARSVTALSLVQLNGAADSSSDASYRSLVVSPDVPRSLRARARYARDKTLSG